MGTRGLSRWVIAVAVGLRPRAPHEPRRVTRNLSQKNPRG